VSTVSALILVGHGHPNDAGNRPFAQVSLAEGDRPVLLLYWARRPRAVGGEVFSTFRMIPTLEHMLDDSILMEAYAVCRHPKVFPEMNRLAKEAPLNTRWLHMYEDFTTTERESLYAMAKDRDDLPKMTWCLFDGTHMEDSMSCLNDYRLECEVNRSVFSRKYEQFSDSWQIRGKLEQQTP
jgi:hypothetical protein